jgi:hypothetical protein
MYPTFRLGAEQLYRNDRALMEQFKKSGRADPMKVERIMEMHTNHVPLYRHVDPEGLGEAGARLGRGITRVHMPFMRAHGAVLDVLDPTVSKALNSAAILATIEQQRVNEMLYKLSKVPGAAMVLEEIPAKAVPQKGTLDEIQKTLEGAGAQLDEIDLTAVFEVWRRAEDRNPKHAQHYDAKDDNTHIIEIKPPELVRALAGMKSSEVGPAVAVFGILNNFLHAGIELSPLFGERHFQRHALYTITKSEFLSMRKYAQGIAAGLAGMFKDDATAKIMRRQGMGLQNIPGLGRKTIEAFLRQQINKRRKGVNYDKMVSTSWDALTYLLRIGDQAVRRPEFHEAYKYALSRGADEATAEIYATYQAWEVSVNYNKQGAWMKEFARQIPLGPFARAHFIGLVKSLSMFVPRRAVPMGPAGRPPEMPPPPRPPKPPPGGWKFPESGGFNYVAKSLLLLGVPTIILYFINRELDKKKEPSAQYKSLPAWRKAWCWNIPLSKSLRDELGVNFLPILKPWADGWLFATLLEAVLEKFDTGNPRAFEHAWEGFDQIIVPDFTPIAGQIALHEAENRDKWGRPIVPMRRMKVKPEYQEGPYTSVWAKWVGHHLKISPAQLDQWREWTTGMFGRDVSQLIDMLARGDKKLPARGMAGIPEVGGAFIAPTGFNAQQIKDFAAVKKQLDIQHATGRLPFEGIPTSRIRRMTDEQKQHVDEVVSENPAIIKEMEQAANEASVYKLFTDVEKAINQDIESSVTIRSNPKMTPEEKRDRNELLVKNAISLAENAINTYDAWRAAPKLKAKHPTIFRVPQPEDAGVPLQ